jgi:adenine nucleotide transporter 17
MTLNTRQHTERADGNLAASASSRVTGEGSLEGTAKKKNPTLVDELRGVMREGDGVKALYRGIEPAVIGTVTSQLVYNYFYSFLRNRSVRREGKIPSALGSLAIASVAGSMNVLLTIPIWTVCVRMQAERKVVASQAETETGGEETNDAKRRGDADDRASEDAGLDSGIRGSSLGACVSSLRNAIASLSRSESLDDFDSDDETAEERDSLHERLSKNERVSKLTFLETTRQVFRESGLSGFWRGVVPSLAMVSNPALQYAFYERASEFFRGRRRRHEIGDCETLGFFEVFSAASLAKLGATVLTYPALLVKTRLQASAGKKGGGGSESYDGALDALRRIVREEGAFALYRGMGTKITQTVFAAALMFVTKEEIQKAVRSARANIRAPKRRVA